MYATIYEPIDVAINKSNIVIFADTVSFHYVSSRADRTSAMKARRIARVGR